MYPIPITGEASRAFKDTVEKFSTESLLEGEMKVSIQNISNRLNLNMLRIDVTKYNPDPDSEDQPDTQSMINMADSAILTDVSVDQSLYFLLKRLVDDKKQVDEGFEDRYSNLNYQELLTGLKYFMSDLGSMAQDPLAGEAEVNFQRIPLTPKFGPMGSASELYAIPGWNDELIELIQNEFSVYPTTQIDFNKLTANMLKILIPSMTDDQVNEFFLWRDDPEKPQFINSKDDFKKYIVNQERLMNETDFENRIKLFESKGISFGSNPNLFKIVSEGSFNRSTYTLVAYVVLPKNEIPKCPEGQIGTPPNCRLPNPGEEIPKPQTSEQNAQLLEPRIIEIQIN